MDFLEKAKEIERTVEPLRHSALPMAKRGKQFEEVVRDIADRKIRAATACLGSAPTGDEAPKEVYAAACQAIADSLTCDGFEYARSKATLKRKTADFHFHIHFQSSHHNVAGELVMLWIHGGVTSRALKTWRATHPSLVHPSDTVAGGQIGNLVKPESWMEWNLASPQRRDDEIADAVATIRELAYPYFDLFGDIAAVRERLVAGDLPSISVASALDFLMCYGSRDEALAFARRIFLGQEEVRERYRQALGKYQVLGLPPYPAAAHGDVLAAATLLFGLPDLETLAPVVSLPMLPRDNPTPAKPLGKAEQKARMTLSKALTAELRVRAKGTGWKVSQGWLFREDSGWFIDARADIHFMEKKASLELRTKPMSIDPVFWDIVEAQNANKLPLSFRLFGAFVVTTPALLTVKLDEDSLDAGGLADLVLGVAKRELERSRKGRSIERFIADLEEHRSRSPSRSYLPAMVCGLILLGRREDARALCVTARAARDGGGFMLGSRSFTDLAIAWLDRIGTASH